MQHFDQEEGKSNDLIIDGAFMANNDLKIKYELHYFQHDFTGSSQKNLESSVLKAIYFAKEGKSDTANYRLAVGIDWIVDLGDEEKNIGSGSDILAPFVGLAIAYNNGVTLIPLVQHYFEYSGNKVNATAFRLIGMKPLEHQAWLKLDAKLPINWEKDNEMPANVELQYGKNITKGLGLYTDVMVGIGKDRPYDWGLGIGIRFKY